MECIDSFPEIIKYFEVDFLKIVHFLLLESFISRFKKKYLIVPIFLEFKLERIENIARSQMAASNTYCRLLRCQVVLNKRTYSEIVLLLKFGFFFCFVTIWVVKFCHNLSCYIWSLFEFLKFSKLLCWICPISSIWVLLEFKFELCYHLSFWIL